MSVYSNFIEQGNFLTLLPLACVPEMDPSSVEKKESRFTAKMLRIINMYMYF
jgi:hypothetical protein